MNPLEDLPADFFCWNMISLEISEEKSINLIIPKEQDMNILI